jgi:hypothetical protein
VARIGGPGSLRKGKPLCAMQPTKASPLPNRALTEPRAEQKSQKENKVVLKDSLFSFG